MANLTLGIAMSDKKTPPKKKGRKAIVVHRDAAMTAIGQKIVDQKNPMVGQAKYPDDIKAAAKALWEGDPTITKDQVAAEMGLPSSTVKRWSQGDEGRAEKWSKHLSGMSERAHEAADKYKANLAELGPEITTEQRQAAEDAANEVTGIEMRGKVLERHRKEWNAPRQISYEAIKAKDFDRMKQAKITSETLKLIQDGERKAWGIDTGPEGGNSVTVVIERE